MDDSSSAESSPATTPNRRSSRKVQTMLGVEGGSPNSTEEPDLLSPGRSPKNRKGTITNMFQKSMERKRSASVAPSGQAVDGDEMEKLRQRISELEMQVFKLEAAGEEREHVVEHYRAKYVAMKRANKGIREQARNMFKALLDGDSRKLDELIRSHYQTFEPEAAARAAAGEDGDDQDDRQLTPRGTHFRAPDDVAGERGKNFRSRDMMFISQGSMPLASTRKMRGSSDPMDGVSSPPAMASPREPGRKPSRLGEQSGRKPSADAKEPMDLSLAGPTIKFKDGTHDIACGSVPDIVDFLINVNRERDFLARFLLLYRQFMSPSDLLMQLKVIMEEAPEVERQSNDDEDTVLYIQPMPGSSTVRQRVGYLLNRWIQDYFDADFRDNAPLRKTISKLVQDVDPGLSVLLDTAMEKSKEARRNALQKQGQSMPAMPTASSSPSVLSLSSSKIPTLGGRKNSVASSSVNLLSLHPMEVAHQMTLIDFDLLDSVEPLDFLKASKDSKKATTVKGLTDHFNRTSAWVATEVIMVATPKERAAKIKFFISVAQSALEIRNFNLLMSILAGLNYSSVQRLKKSWKLVPPKLVQSFEQLEHVMSSAKNFQAYRAALDAADYPKLPYFGVFLRDLQFIDVGNDTWVGSEEDAIVNFEKVTMMEGLLQELDNFKTYNEFPWTAIPVLQSFLKLLPSLDEETLHRNSVLAEPISTTGVNYLDEDASPRSPKKSPKAPS